MSKSVKDQTVKAFQVGGAVNPQTGVYQLPNTGITGFQQAPMSTTGFNPNQPIQPYFKPTQFTQAQYQDPLQVTNIPTFGDTVGTGFGQFDEEKTFVNDAGQILKVPFKDGKPIYPIPEGYSEQGAAPKEEQAPTTTITPTTGQTQVTDGGGRDDDFYTTPKGGGVTVKTPKGKSFTTTTLEQNQKKYGYTGKQGINLATALAVLTGNPLSALASVSGFMPEKIGDFSIEAFGTPPTPGMTGTVEYGDLVSIANGTTPVRSEDLMSQQMAKDVLAMQSLIGTSLTGITGYKPGDLNPVTGSFVNVHGAALDGFVSGTHSYTSIKTMINTVKKGIAAGWRGGYVSAEVYKEVLTDAQKANYNKFDPTHENTADADRADAGLTGSGRGEEDMTRDEIAREDAQTQEMVDTGQVPADVQTEIDAALEAAGRSDLTSGNIGKQGTSFDDSAMGKGSGSGPDKGGNDSSGSGGGGGFAGEGYR